MRKSDREITDFNEIKELVDNCDTLRLGFNDSKAPYIVPLSFGFEASDGEFIFYVHGAAEGRRHTLARENAFVCVELDVCNGFVELDGKAQTCDYRSFIGTGRMCAVTGDEAVHALTLISQHCGFDGMYCSQEVIKNTCVEKITVSEFTAKQRFTKASR